MINLFIQNYNVYSPEHLYKILSNKEISAQIPIKELSEWDIHSKLEEFLMTENIKTELEMTYLYNNNFKDALDNLIVIYEEDILYTLTTDKILKQYVKKINYLNIQQLDNLNYFNITDINNKNIESINKLYKLKSDKKTKLKYISEIKKKNRMNKLILKQNRDNFSNLVTIIDLPPSYAQRPDLENMNQIIGNEFKKIILLVAQLFSIIGNQSSKTQKEYIEIRKFFTKKIGMSLINKLENYIEYLTIEKNITITRYKVKGSFRSFLVIKDSYGNEISIILSTENNYQLEIIKLPIKYLTEKEYREYNKFPINPFISKSKDNINIITINTVSKEIINILENIGY